MENKRRCRRERRDRNAENFSDITSDPMDRLPTTESEQEPGVKSIAPSTEKPHLPTFDSNKLIADVASRVGEKIGEEWISTGFGIAAVIEFRKYIEDDSTGFLFH